MTIARAMRLRSYQWRREADQLSAEVANGAALSMAEEITSLAVAARLRKCAYELERLVDMAD